MKNLTQILKMKSDNDTFNYIINTFKNKISTFDWIVNWEKVQRNISDIEISLNIMNSLIGKEKLEENLKKLLDKIIL